MKTSPKSNAVQRPHQAQEAGDHLSLPPSPGAHAGQMALRALLTKRSILASLEALHHAMGDVFQIALPGFRPIFLVGPEANRFVTVTGRDDLRWRPEGDPVTELLRCGLLVTDGDFHDKLRQIIMPPLHKRHLAEYVPVMWRRTNQISANWRAGAQINMLVEMRKVALLILMETLFGIDFSPDLPRLWPAILKLLAYISPGAWLLSRRAPRFGYQGAIQEIDRYLYGVIAARRASPEIGDDVLGRMIASPEMNDDLIRDQLLTLLIAGHDTSTALLAWSLYLLGEHPAILDQITAEVDGALVSRDQPPTLDELDRLDLLDRALQEALRMYPPIHLGNRIAAADLAFNGCRIPAGSRVVYSIYLSHRQPEYWPEPERFNPDRFLPENSRERPHYTYIPFGSGPRNCIGMAFARVEAKVILARLVQTFTFERTEYAVHPHMGATLEPRPGVYLRVRPREAVRRER